ncbi:MAG: PQQ-binding-like beta-propeller repeat protein [Armatimonadetes bacterium]|nr:PQQ-binding-like beta-propeller repeat protein [Armatimonadota bacterium]
MQRRVVATGDRVYATLGYLAPVTELDAATGRVLRTFPDTEGTEEIIVHKGVLVAAVRRVTEERRKNFEWVMKLDREVEKSLWTRETRDEVEQKFVQTDRKAPQAIVAVDLKAGGVLWGKDARKGDFQGYRPMTLCAEGDRVFFGQQQSVTCLDLRTGEVIWDRKAPAVIRAVAKGLVLIDRWTGRDQPHRIIAVAANDGHVVWEVETLLTAIRDVFVIGESVWLGGFKPAPEKRGPEWGPYYLSEHSLATGQLIRHIEPRNPGHHHRCYSNKATVNYILAGRRGTEVIDVKTGEVLWNNWARGVCRYGIMPAYGLLYQPPHACGCYVTTMLYGFNALATGRPGPTERAAERIDKGPGFSAAAAASDKYAADDWPTYRHDPARSGCTPAPAPETLVRRWEVKLGGRLTQPVVAAGRVYVAEVDEHSLSALDAQGGRPLWKFTAGGRIDSPPTVLGSLIVFGCRDGYVYALRASDGALAWRLRAAPQERFIPVSGQLESAWPVHGAVLVRGGKLFVLAGRSSYIDGGMSFLRVNPKSGRIEAAAQLYSPDPETGRPPQEYGPWGEPGTRADIVSADEQSIYLRHLAYDENGREQPHPRPHLYTLTDFVEDIWPHRSYWIYGTEWSIAIGCMARKKDLIYARLFAVGPKALYGYGRSNVHWSNMLEDGEYRLFAADRATGERLWQQTMPIHVRALVLARDKLVVAGPPVAQAGEHWFPDPSRPGKLLVLSEHGGEKLAQTDLPAPPVLDGIAVAEGRIFASLTDGRVVSLGR